MKSETGGDGGGSEAIDGPDATPVPTTGGKCKLRGSRAGCFLSRLSCVGTGANSIHVVTAFCGRGMKVT